MPNHASSATRRRATGRPARGGRARVEPICRRHSADRATGTPAARHERRRSARCGPRIQWERLETCCARSSAHADPTSGRRIEGGGIGDSDRTRVRCRSRHSRWGVCTIQRASPSGSHSGRMRCSGRTSPGTVLASVAADGTTDGRVEGRDRGQALATRPRRRAARSISSGRSMSLQSRAVSLHARSHTVPDSGDLHDGPIRARFASSCAVADDPPYGCLRHAPRPSRTAPARQSAGHRRVRRYA